MSNTDSLQKRPLFRTKGRIKEEDESVPYTYKWL